jgi:hypothetical protein
MDLALLAPDRPVALAYVFDWWLELSSPRQMGFASANPISFGEIHSWAVLTRRRVSPPEVELLRKLDAIFLRVRADDA